MSARQAASGSDVPTTRGQFKATRMWKDLVHHLYQNVNFKKKRISMRSRTECFSGGNAADTMLIYVQENRTRFPNTTMVTRENIIRLCQSFMETSVIECVNAGEDSERRTKFEDSSSRLYRFNTEKKREFMKENLMGSPPKLQCIGNRHSIATEVELLPTKFSTLLNTPRSAGSMRRHKVLASPVGSRRKKYDTTDQRENGFHSDVDSENHPPMTRRTPKLKRSRSLVGFLVGRSTSDPDLAKRSTSCESGSESKRQSSGDRLTRGRLRLSQRMSLTRRSLRRTGHSSYDLQPSCVIQNHATEHNDLNPVKLSRDEVKRKSKRHPIIPGNQNEKVKVISTRKMESRLTQQEMSKVKRESVRVRLLQLIEVPFVETVVFSPTLDKKVLGPSQTENMWLNSQSGTQHGNVIAAYNKDDPWIYHALSVLQHIPDGHDTLRKHMRLSDHRKRIELYFAIAEHYKSSQRRLIDENYNQVARAIISLLVSRPVDKTMEATQLFLHLIPDTRFAELQRLCTFLHTICNQKETKLVLKGSNQALVVDTFTGAILRLPEFVAMENGLDGRKGLVRFIVQHCEHVFKLPAAIEAAVQRKIELLERGEENPPIVSDSYCSIISEAEYQKQRITYTYKQVRELYAQILTDSTINAKKKKDLIKKLQKQHPEVFGVDKGDSDKVGGDEKRQLVLQTSSLFALSRPKRAGVPESPKQRHSADFPRSQSHAGLMQGAHRMSRSTRRPPVPDTDIAKRKRTLSRHAIYV